MEENEGKGMKEGIKKNKNKRGEL